MARPITPKTITMMTAYAAATAPPAAPSSAMMTPSWAEQGMANAMSAVAMRRSRSLPRMRVVIVAIVMQPKPRMMGTMARPLSPMVVIRRSDRAAMRGR